MDYIKLSFLIFLCETFYLLFFKFLPKFFNCKGWVSTDYFKILPEEITLEILSRLPVDSILNCKLVRTNWRGLVTQHPSFSNLHLQHLNRAAADSGKVGFIARNGIKNLYYFEYNVNHDQSSTVPPIERITRMNFTPPSGFKIVGSCNGLVCLVRGPHVCIFNPINKEYVMLPKIKADCCYVECYSYGTRSFGYVESTNEYKILAMYLPKLSPLEVHIYTLGSGNGWRSLGNFNSDFGLYYNWNEPGVFVSGVLYWMAIELKRIITFNLAEEVFCQDLSLPPLPTGGDWRNSRIGVSNGCLSFSISLCIGKVKHYDIWLLRKKNDKKTGEEYQSLGWSKEIRIDESNLLAITKSGVVLTYKDNYLNIYDTKTSTSKSLVKFKNWFLQVSPHKNTLVSLKELGEEDIESMGSVETEEPRSCDYHFKQKGTPEYLFL